MNISEILNPLNSYNTNNILPKNILFHHAIKIVNGRKTYKDDLWFKNIVLNELKNLVPFLSIYPVKINGQNEIDRTVAIGNGLNPEELEMINESNGQYNFNKIDDDCKVKIIGMNETDSFMFVLVQAKLMIEKQKNGDIGVMEESTTYYEILLQKRNLGESKKNRTFREEFFNTHGFNMANFKAYLQIIFNIANDVLNYEN